MSEFTGDMTAAVEAAFSSASTPVADTTTTVETPAPSATETATTGVEATPPSETTPPAEPGPIPYARFKEINEKAQAASKELEALGWAKGIDPQIVQEFARVQQIAKTNPLIWTEQLEAIRDHPVLGPQLRSWAARTLGFRQTSRLTEGVEEQEPQPDIPLEDGRKVYSAEQLHKREQWLLKQWESRIDEKLQPIAQKGAKVDELIADREYAAIKAKADSDAKSEIDELNQRYPQFWEHKDDVVQVMKDHPTYTLKQAWAQVFVDKVGPKLAVSNAAAVKQKVAAGSANPARPSGAAPSAPTDFAEALRQHFPART